MPVVYYGHSAVEIRSRDGSTRIFIDPWLKNNPSCPENLKDQNKIDLICLTHGHSDHTEDAVSLSKKTGAKIAAIWDLCDLLVNEGIEEDNLIRLNIGGSFKFNDFTITMTQAIHSSSFKTSSGDTKYAGLAAGFIVRTPSNIAIYHAGDTSLFSDLKLIGELYKPDIALLPCGDRVTMGSKEAGLAAQFLKAKFIIPIHYKTFSILDQNPEVELEKLLKDGQHLIALKPGEEFSVKSWEAEQFQKEI